MGCQGPTWPHVCFFMVFSGLEEMASWPEISTSWHVFSHLGLCCRSIWDIYLALSASDEASLLIMMLFLFLFSQLNTSYFTISFLLKLFFVCFFSSREDDIPGVWLEVKTECLFPTKCKSSLQPEFTAFWVTGITS